MIKLVTKKDGTKEPFDAEKIRKAIAAAASQSSLSPEEQTRVVGQVQTAVMENLGSKEEVTSTEIKENILSELDIHAPAVSAAWREYEQGK